MTKNKIQIKRDGGVITVLDEEGRTLYSSARHSDIKKDNHPFMAGFSKIADLGDSYADMLTLLRLNKSSNKLKNYWENVGHYALDVMSR